MPLRRGEAIGYDADLMAFKFTMRNGENIVQCEISHAALSDLACRAGKAATRDLSSEFEEHREFIEALASAQFDQTPTRETRLVRIFAKHIPNRTSPPPSPSAPTSTAPSQTGSRRPTPSTRPARPRRSTPSSGG